jgi:hypothetical protein
MTSRFNSLAALATMAALAATSAPVLAANVQAASQPSMTASAAKSKPKVARKKAHPPADAPSGVVTPNPLPGGQGTAPKKPTSIAPAVMQPPAGMASAAK